MSIDLGLETPAPRRKKKRTWRTSIESGYGQIPVLTAHREIAKINEDGTLDGNTVQVGAVTRTYSPEIGAKTKTLKNKKVISIDDILEALPMFIDDWDQEDMDAVARAIEEQQAAQEAKT